MKQLIDLHMHSIYSSDGEYTPKELLDYQKKLDIDLYQLLIIIL